MASAYRSSVCESRPSESSEADPFARFGCRRGRQARPATVGSVVPARRDHASADCPPATIVTSSSSQAQASISERIDGRAALVTSAWPTADALAARAGERPVCGSPSAQHFEYGKREGSHNDPDGNLIRFGSPLRR